MIQLPRAQSIVRKQHPTRINIIRRRQKKGNGSRSIAPFEEGSRAWPTAGLYTSIHFALDIAIAY